ncbi:HAD family hydrolase [Crenothrix sp.]|jgi:phosphoglycolate phosphatase|uniref:HAD family hydrolase n=1 Tax=Crenothrix sp. TaxID=3100433 RepID=UPI00374DE52D
MNNKFDLIIFDWDGTLINSIDWIAHCLQKAGQVCGFIIPELQEAKNVIGLSIHHAMLALFPDADKIILEKLVDCYSQEYFSKQLSRDDFFPGVYDMLLHLKQSGYQLAVATGKNRLGLEQALSATDTRDLFCVTRCADETASKPDPKMLHEIMDHTNTAKHRTLMVGDSVHDLQMASNAQIVSVGVLCGSHTEDFLQQHNPLACLRQPTELLDFI